MKRTLRLRSLISYGVLLAAMITASPVPAQDKCERLSRARLPQVTIMAAERLDAGPFQAPDGQRYAVPQLCRIHGVSRPTQDSEIHFEVWLPYAWNGRYQQFGQGGGGGAISYRALASYAEEGMVGAATDDGHGVSPDGDFAWALHHPEKIVDDAYRGLQETNEAAQRLIRAYYGHAPSYRYFEGCSGGGDYALIAAQRFPKDWDGILVGAPPADVLGYVAGSAWKARVWLDETERIGPQKLPAIERAALASCRAEAQVIGGIATDPRFCPFDPATLLCQGPERDDCLTSSQIVGLRKLYNGPRNPRTGAQIYPGMPATSEVSWEGIMTQFKPPNQARYGGVPASFIPPRRQYRNKVFDDPQWDVSAFDFDRDLIFAQEKNIAGRKLGEILDASNPDLSVFRRHGGKMLLYFGWADPSLSPLEGIAYYEKAAQAAGGLPRAREFFRLFMVPGMGHCGGGAGANVFGQMDSARPHEDPTHNILAALRAWVEHGRSPDELIATKYVDNDLKGRTQFTRLLCPYPQMNIYNGSGYTADARNFHCANSAPATEQAPPDFSGSWTAVPSQAASGAEQGAAPPTLSDPGTMGSGWADRIKLTQDHTSLTVESSYFHPRDFQPPFRLRYALDGTASSNSIHFGRGPQEQRSSVHWEGATLVIVTMHRFVNPHDGQTVPCKVIQRLTLESPAQLVIETQRSAALGGEASVTRTIYLKSE